MTFLTMFGIGIMFGLGHSVAPYIILAMKARKVKKAQKRLLKKQKKMKGEIE